MTTASGFKTNVGGKKTALIDMFYPVGSIYQSTKYVNPGDFMGGTWRSITDRFLLASGNTYQAGAMGGEAAHTLTEGEMPSHGHGDIYAVDNSKCWAVPTDYNNGTGAAGGGCRTARSRHRARFRSTRAMPGGGLRTTTCLPTSSCTCGSAPRSLVGGAR